LLVISCTIACAATQSKTASKQAPEVGHENPALNLAMGQWRFVMINGTQVSSVGRQQPYLKFESRDNSVTGFTGCNRLHGNYRAEDSKLKVEHVASTRMACPGENHEQEVLDVLNSVTGYKIAGHELHLLGPKGTLAILMRPHEEQTTQQKPAEK
jgi:heat shock protein HslJ